MPKQKKRAGTVTPPIGKRIPPAVLWTGLFTVVGVMALLAVRAASPYIAIEPENTSLNGVVVERNTGASGGSAVSFHAPTTGATGRCQHTATRVCYNGKLWYINGVDIPWINWNADFGGGGVVSNRTEITNRLTNVHNTGSSVARWWMFEGGAWQINRDSNGMPTSLNPAIYTDIDAALQIAQQQDIYFDFTLFGGMSADSIPTVWRTNTTYRQALADVLAPLFARYKDNSRVMAWEIWNEPEWQYWNSIDGATKEQATDMASRIIAVIRREAPKAMTTVGQANISSLADWKNVDLDFDSPHWYDGMTGTSDCALCSNNASIIQSRSGTTRPIVLGEYYEGGGTVTQNLARLNDIYGRGYGGAWAWSLFFDHTSDQLKVDLNAMTTFGQQHTDIGPH